METPGNNVILIGMPGSGKSTVGVLLAKHLGFAFLDTDLLIQSGEGRRLHALIQQHGIEGFKDLEATYLLTISAQQTIIATGGSVVYRDQGMAHLQKLGRIVFLEISLKPLLKRLESLDERGVVYLPGQTFESIYNERRPLYRKYGQLNIATDNLTPEQVVRSIQKSLVENHWCGIEGIGKK
jgi:shikimate kinase